MRNLKRIPGILVLLVGGAFAVQGCSLKKQPPEKRYFVLEAQPDREFRARVGEVSLGIRKFRVSPLFGGSNLVYRKSDVKYEPDFYNQFLVSPSQMFTEVAYGWLSTSGLFRDVLDFSSASGFTHVLEGRVNSLYADYRERVSPRAVLEIEVFIIENPLGRPRLIFHKRYREEVPFKSGSVDALLEGWNDGIKKIMTGFEEDIRSLEFSVPGEED
jgi:uncharacterized lipoprotein YmbA